MEWYIPHEYKASFILEAAAEQYKDLHTSDVCIISKLTREEHVVC